jgi:uncharacterized membrane protein
MRKTFIIVFCAVLLAAAFAGCAPKQKEAGDIPRYHAIVTSVRVEEQLDSETGGRTVYQYLKVKPTEGEYKDQLLETTVSIDISNSKSYFIYHAGDGVFVEIYLKDGGGIDYVSLYTMERAPYVIGIFVLLLLLIGVIGRKKGLKTIVALLATVAGVFGVIVPVIGAGGDPVLIAVIVCIAITFVTMFTVGGFNRKALAAALGTMGGLLSTLILTVIVNQLLRVSAVEMESVDMLMTSNLGIEIDFNGILMAAIMVGGIGAMMDVGIDIASSINEIHEVNPFRTPKQLFESGISVGRDVMGTMANTLILAYTGCSLMLMVNWAVFSESFFDMINNGYIVVEVIKALVGSIGMVLTIPITAFIGSRMIFKEEATKYKDTVGAEIIFGKNYQLAAENKKPELLNDGEEAKTDVPTPGSEPPSMQA